MAKQKIRRHKAKPRACDCCGKPPTLRKSMLNEYMAICENKDCKSPRRTTWLASESSAVYDWNNGHTKPARDVFGMIA